MHAHTGTAEEQAIKVIGTYHLSELANWTDQCKKWNVSIRSNLLPNLSAFQGRSVCLETALSSASPLCCNFLTGCCCGPILTNGKCPQMYFLVVIATRLNSIYVSLILLREAHPWLVINPGTTLTLKQH